MLDRVYLRTGSRKWWGALSGRARVQRMLKHHREGEGAVRAQSAPQGRSTVRLTKAMALYNNAISCAMLAEGGAQGPQQLWAVRPFESHPGQVSRPSTLA